LVDKYHTIPNTTFVNLPPLKLD